MFRTTEGALKRCYSALNYVARKDAIGNVCWRGLRDENGHNIDTVKAARLALRKRFRIETAKGGAVGRRLATTGIVSLPNSWTDEVVLAAMHRLSNELAPDGSEASVFIVQHIDKSNNAHLHFIAVDGIESIESAKQRAKPNTQRIRRQNVQRFNERGAPKIWRKRIAECLNSTAEEHDVARVEWRSFRDRGLRRKATAHDGPSKRARNAENQTLNSIKEMFNCTDDLEGGLDILLNATSRAVRIADKVNIKNGGEQRQRE